MKTKVMMPQEEAVVSMKTKTMAPEAEAVAVAVAPPKW
jgi:hypothetical protein